MLKKFDKKLKKVYFDYKDKNDSNVPIKKIRRFLEIEGVLNEKD
jgi:hypothetical protein